MNKLITFLLMTAVTVMGFRANIFLGFAIVIGIMALMYYINYPDIMVARGNAELNKKNNKTALAYYEKAYRCKRHKFPVDIAYAQALLRTGNCEKSLEIVNKVLGFSYLRPQIKLYAKQTRVLINYKLGNLEEAYDEAKEMFADGYTTSNMYCLIGLLMIAKGEPMDETLAFCEKAYDYDSDNRDNVDNLLVCYIKTGDFQKAKDLADDLTERFPDFVEGWYHSAQVYYELGDKEKSLECIGHAKTAVRTYLTTVSESEIESFETMIG